MVASVTRIGSGRYMESLAPSDAFAHHFLKCLFCRLGDRYTEDHFCQIGRDLLVALVDEWADKVEWIR